MERGLASAVDLAQNTASGGGNKYARKGGREHRAFHLHTCIHEHRCKQEHVHSRIHHPAKGTAPRRKKHRNTESTAARRKKDEAQEHGHEHCIEKGDALHPPPEEETGKCEPQYGKERLIRGKKRVEPREHSRTRHEGAEQNDGVCNRRSLAEQGFQNSLVAAVFFPCFQHERTAQKEEYTGKERGPKEALRGEKTDEFRPRDEPRPDSSPDNKQCPA